MGNQVQLHNSRIGQGSTNFQQPTFSVEFQTKQHHLQHQKSSIIANQNEVTTDRITIPCDKDSDLTTGQRN